MCDWKHWLVFGEEIEEQTDKEEQEEWDYYDEEYCLRKLGVIRNRERNDIGF